MRMISNPETNTQAETRNHNKTHNTLSNVSKHLHFAYNVYCCVINVKCECQSTRVSFHPYRWLDGTHLDSRQTTRGPPHPVLSLPYTIQHILLRWRKTCPKYLHEVATAELLAGATTLFCDQIIYIARHYKYKVEPYRLLLLFLRLFNDEAAWFELLYKFEGYTISLDTSHTDVDGRNAHFIAAVYWLRPMAPLTHL